MNTTSRSIMSNSSLMYFLCQTEKEFSSGLMSDPLGRIFSYFNFHIDKVGWVSHVLIYCWTVLLLSEFNSAIRFHYYWNRSSLLAWTMDILLIISAFVLLSLHVMVNFKHIIYWKLSKGARKFKFSFASVCSFLLLYQT